MNDLYQLFKASTGISTDSRKIKKGNLFFALKGPNFDGNQFALQCLEKGASYAVVDDQNLEKHKGLIFVDDVLKTLQNLATFHRRQFKIPIIAITGSNGKTTTKELISEILGLHYQTHFTKGNFNNHLGVPLTLLEIEEGTEMAVIEMGANHQGEIAKLCEIAEPTHGVITNIGKAHLEGFGGIEGVKRGKSELYRYLAAHNGVAFVNLDEKFLDDLSNTVNRKVLYLQSAHPDSAASHLETKLLEVEPNIKVAFWDDERTKLVEAKSHLPGIYNFNNIQTAVSIGRYFEVPAFKIKKAIETYYPQNNRSQILKHAGNTFILDAYNANPTSMRNALEHLAKRSAEKKIAIIGDMLELGEYSVQEHQSILDDAGAKAFDYLIIVGEEFGKTEKGKIPCLHFMDIKALKDWFWKQKFENYLILLKGSRGISLEKLLD